MNKQLTISGKKICNFALILLQLPNFLFALEWLSGIWSLIYIGILGVGTVCAYIVIKKKMSSSFIISVKGLFVLGIGVAVITWVCGIGGYFPQCYDWYVRNPIYRDLINYDWPVVYQETGYGLCYYIGFWLPPAFLTKIFGIFGCGEWTLLNIGNVILCIWSFMCLLCVFLMIFLKIYKCKAVNCKAIAVVLGVFVAYGGLSILGEKIAETLGMVSDSSCLNGLMIEHWSADIIIMNSNITMLMNVFNQLIPAWIATMFFVNLIDTYELFGFIGFSICISAPFPMVGLGILMLGAIVKKVCEERKIDIRKLCSLPNLCSLAMLVVGCLYFIGSNSASVTINNIFTSVKDVNPIVWLFIVFLLTFGGWTIVVFMAKRNYSVVYVAISIILLSAISVSGTIDFAMRASIPGYFIIMLFVLECLSGDVHPGIGEKARSCLPIMLTISFMTVWICFWNLCEEAVAAKTTKKTYDMQTLYSLEGNADNYDFGILTQYTKRNLNEDIFFSVLAGTETDCQYPVIQKAIDDVTGEVKIVSVDMKLSQKEWFISLIADEDKKYALEQIALQIGKSESGKVEFEDALAIKSEVEISDGDLDVQWLDYSPKIQVCNSERFAHILITNNSDKVIPFSDVNAEKLGIGFFATLTDETEKEMLITYSKINRFIFPDESVSLGIMIPQYAGERGKTYMLQFGVYQRTEGENGIIETYYEVSPARKYIVEYK